LKITVLYWYYNFMLTFVYKKYFNFIKLVNVHVQRTSLQSKEINEPEW
jgi:hypothetical protein